MEYRVRSTCCFRECEKRPQVEMYSNLIGYKEREYSKKIKDRKLKKKIDRQNGMAKNAKNRGI